MVRVVGASKQFGGKVVLDQVSHEFATKATTAIIGPSGCGKSTLLRTLVGLVDLDAGQVFVNGIAVTPTTVVQIRRQLGYVIQDGGLFPHLTAEANVTLLPRHLGRSEREIRERVQMLAHMTQLPNALLTRYPAQLSGGQKQRVALMRALMLEPEILLLDEPLGSLDPIIRYELQEELKRIFSELGQTVIVVTHDMAEAHFFAQDIVLLQEGRIAQKGSMDQFVSSPATPFVTQFLKAHRALPA